MAAARLGDSSMKQDDRSLWHAHMVHVKSRLWEHPFVRWLLRQAPAFRRRTAPWCARTVEGVSFQCTMFVVTIYALLGDDLRLFAFEKPADLVFNVITIVTLFLFMFEIVASCFGKEDYFLSFFFFLDLVATTSLILDITWVYESLILGGDTSMARAGRMSRVGTRAGRLIRVIRLIRLIRIAKLYRHITDVSSRIRGNGNKTLARPGEVDPQDQVYAESRVGQKLSHMMTQKVIVLILSMLLLLPLFTVEQWFQDMSTAAQYGADVTVRSYSDCRRELMLYETGEGSAVGRETSCLIFEQKLAMYIGELHQNNYFTCHTLAQQAFNDDCEVGLGWVGFQVDAHSFKRFKFKRLQEHWDRLFHSVGIGPDTLPNDLASRFNTGECFGCGQDGYALVSFVETPRVNCPEDLRIVEQVVVEASDTVPEYTQMIFVLDLRPWVHRTAIFSTIQTLFICAILAAGAMIFSHDANTLVLQPIERMIALVTQIRDNPLYATKFGDDAYRYGINEDDDEKDEMSTKKSFTEKILRCPFWRSSRVKEQALETKILENAIVKLGKLLALGFGEAGSEIIVKNMVDDSAIVDAMIPGSKVEAVFGVCDILNFTDTTEVLQDKVMVFVNCVAEIVHDIVDEWHGAASGNNGQAFLMVWRLLDETPAVRAKICDMAVISFAHVLAAVSKSAVLKEYSEHPALLARIPNYKVGLGFGLHFGWAIEGAIGSHFKIDVSYLSPHVNVTGELEALTQLYQVPICISDTLKNNCSDGIQPYFRAMDHVAIKDVMSTPMRLYTIDLYTAKLTGSYYLKQQGGENRFEMRLLREKAKEAKLLEAFKVQEHLENDPDILQMRSIFKPRFYQQFQKGFLNYEAGEWHVARTVFEETQQMLEAPDGPSKALLDYMSTFRFDSSRATPKGWLGHRQLKFHA